MLGTDDRLTPLDPDDPRLFSTKISSFGGPDDMEDNGQFAGGGGSILPDGSIDPEPYAAVPQDMIDSGAIKYGDRIKVTNPKTGLSTMVIAKDIGPSANDRGIDVAPHVLQALDMNTDDEAILKFFPDKSDFDDTIDSSYNGEGSAHVTDDDLETAVDQAGDGQLQADGSVKFQNGITVMPNGFSQVEINGQQITYDPDGKKVSMPGGGKTAFDPYQEMAKHAAAKGVLEEDYKKPDGSIDRDAFKKAARDSLKSGGEDDDVDAIAQAIISGDQPPTLQGLYRYGKAVRGKLAKEDYPLAQAQIDWQATTKLIQTLNGPQQTRLRQAAQFSHDSLDIVQELSDKWKAGNYPIINKARLVAATNGALGPEAQNIATQLLAQINDLTSEFAVIYQGGNTPTDHALQLAAKNLSADFPEGVMDNMIQLSKKNIQIRLNSIKQTGVSGVGESRYAPDQEGDGTTPPVASPVKDFKTFHEKSTGKFWRMYNDGHKVEVDKFGNPIANNAVTG